MDNRPNAKGPKLIPVGHQHFEQEGTQRATVNYYERRKPAQ